MLAAASTPPPSPHSQQGSSQRASPHRAKSHMNSGARPPCYLDGCVDAQLKTPIRSLASVGALSFRFDCPPPNLRPGRIGSEANTSETDVSCSFSRTHGQVNTTERDARSLFLHYAGSVTDADCNGSTGGIVYCPNIFSPHKNESEFSDRLSGRSHCHEMLCISYR